MKKYIAFLVGTIFTFVSFSLNAAYGRPMPGRGWMCNPYNHICHKIERNEQWRSSYGKHGWKKYTRKKHSAKNTEPRHVFVAPPEKIDEGNIVNVNLAHGTWGAYDAEGNLVNSGHVSGGKSFCPDIGKKCRTATGTFTVYTKQGAGCKSKIFPVGKGGAPMPYCMFFHKGFAMHGSNAVPNYNASHGCVRMTPADAKWLNQNFVSVGSTRVRVTYDKMEPAPKEEKVAIEKSS